MDIDSKDIEIILFSINGEVQDLSKIKSIIPPDRDGAYWYIRYTDGSNAHIVAQNVILIERKRKE